VLSLDDVIDVLSGELMEVSKSIQSELRMERDLRT